MKQSASQKGFGAIGVVAIILVVAVIAFAGWYVWNKNKKDDTKPSGQTAQNQNQPKPDEQKPADPTEGGKYLVISEWGVRFPLSEEFRGDVKYRLSAADADGSQFADFEVGRIASLPATKCTFNGGDGIGIALARLKDEPSEEEKRGYGEENIHHYGAFWYQATFIKAACAATDEDEQKTGDTRAALGQLMRQLEVVPQQ